MANILDRLVASPHSDLKVLYPIADFDDHAGAFVACARCAELGHLGKGPVIHHEVNVGHAEAGGVELDKDILGA